MSGGFGLPVLNLQSALGGLGTAYNASFDAAQKKTALAKLGEQIQGGDFAGSAQTAFAAGDVETGIGLLKLGETRRQSALAEKASQDFAAGLMGVDGTVGASPGASNSRNLPSFADSSGPAGSYVANLFKRESNNNTMAQAPTSSARGLGQFTKDTWNGVARKYPDLALTPVGGGQDGRTDPNQMLRATKAFTAENEAILGRANLPVNDATRYAVHFLGAGGGPRFVAATLANPDRPAASVVSPEQASANRRIFYNRDGSPKTAGEVMNDFQRSFAGGSSRVAQRPAGPRVAYAGNEAQTQALEQQMGMVPLAQTAANDPRADMPVEGGQVAALVPPGNDLVAPPASALPQDQSQIPTLGGSAAGGRVMTMPGALPSMSPDAASAAHVSVVAENSAGRAPVANDASAGNPLGARIPLLMKALANPNLPEGQRQLAQTLLREGLEQARIPDGVKEFMWARANGMTKAQSPAEYARESKGPTTLAPGSSLVGADGRIITTAPNRENKVSDDIDARKAAALDLGLVPGTPAYQSYTLTGKMPREDQPLPSAADRRAIGQAEDALPVIDGTIETLTRAKELNDKTYTGLGAQALAWTGTSFPGSSLVLNPKTAEATREFGQIMTMEAIKSMSQVLKGATTDTEMGRFIEILGDPTTPPKIREKTIERMLTLAQRQKAIATDRVNELRTGTYYRPGGGQSAPAAAGASSRALPAPSPANRPGASSAGDRFGSLVGSGMSKQQAYEQLQREGY